MKDEVWQILEYFEQSTENKQHLRQSISPKSFANLEKFTVKHTIKDIPIGLQSKLHFQYNFQGQVVNIQIVSERSLAQESSSIERATLDFGKATGHSFPRGMISFESRGG